MSLNFYRLPARRALTHCAIVASWALLILFSGQAYSQASERQIDMQKLRECAELSNLPKFDVIRLVFSLGHEVTDQMLGARILPSKVQRDALRAYHATVLACNRRVLFNGNPLTAATQLAQDSEDLKLNLLAEAKMTFADYALLEKVRSDTNRFWIEQIESASAAAARAPRPVTGLVCTFETAEVRGLEVFVRFDESTRQVWANRGGSIGKTWIDSTTIGYEQNNSTFVISRLTGRINWSGSGVGILGTGQCVTATTQKF